MKKLRALSLLPFVCLTSCGKQERFIGTYSFMLGKEKESHVRIAMELTKDEYKVKESGQEVVKGNRFKASIDTGGMLDIDISTWGIPLPEDIDIENLNRIINEIISEELNDIEGYYSITDNQTSPLGYRVKLGAVIDIAEELGLDIPGEFIEHIIVSYVNDKSLTIQMPVSFTDLQMQLCWYGFYVDLNDSAEKYVVDLTAEGRKLPGEQNDELRVGTHPKFELGDDGQIKVDEVTEMNETFAGYFSNTPVYQGTKYIGSLFEKDEHVYFMKDSEFNPSDANIDCKVMLRNAYGVYDVETQAKMVVDIQSLKEATEGKVVQLKDLSDVDLLLKKDKLIRKPFVFRDFHDIKVGLAKE